MTEPAQHTLESSSSASAQVRAGASLNDDEYETLDTVIRRGFHVAALVVMMLFTLAYLVAIVVWITKDETLRAILTAQMRTFVGVPLSAIAGFCIVVVLENTSGRVEISGFGLKFRGAAGPVVLWIFCTLALVSCIKILWN